MREDILAAALRRARRAGYDGFSFRDVAADVGIKSASVHYHFPTKAELTAALIGRYRRDLFDRLGPAGALPWQAAVTRLVALFRAAAADRSACLCAALGGTAAHVPPAVRDAIAEFTSALIGWLRSAEGEGASGLSAESVIALLEGALLIANLHDDPALFDRSVDGVLSLVGQHAPASKG